MLEGQPIANRRTVIHHVHRVTVRPQLGEQAVDEIGVVRERVGERPVIGRIAAAETRIIGCDDAVAVREERDQVAEHVR